MNTICILGESNSLWTLKCIEKPELTDRHRVILYSTGDNPFSNWYQAHNVSVIIPTMRGPLFHIPKLRGLLYYMRYLQGLSALRWKLGPFDTLHISYVTTEKLVAAKMLRPHCRKIVCTFWGSDLLRADEKHLRHIRRYLEYVDIITLSTDEMERRFLEVFGDAFRNRVRRVRFGVEGLDALASLDCSREEIRRQLQLPEGKLVVAIGYNGHEGQNHLRVLQVISDLPSACREMLVLQFPLTYGLTPDYRVRLISALNKTGCEYRLVESFQDLGSLAKLRMSCDIFIHAQSTDAFSASVQEYLYAEKLVLNPTWIVYPDLVKSNVYYKEYRDFEELKEILLSVLKHGLSSAEREKLRANSEKMEKISSWSSVAKDWEALYC